MYKILLIFFFIEKRKDMLFIFILRGMCCGFESLILCLEISCCFCFCSCYVYGFGGSVWIGEGGGNLNVIIGL